MSVSSSVIKKTAKTALKDHYSGSIISAAAFTFLCIVCFVCAELGFTLGGTFGGILYLAAVLTFLLVPLTLGYVYENARLIFAGEQEPILLFKYFSSASLYKRALKFSLFIVSKAFVAGAIVFFPVFAANMLASGKFFALIGAEIPMWTSALWAVLPFFKVIAAILFVSVLLKYHLAPFLMAADEDMDPMEAANMSKIICSGSKRNFVWLFFSFTGYIIACLFVVPIIFVFPYFGASYAVYCRFAVAAYNKRIDDINKPIPTFEVLR